MPTKRRRGRRGEGSVYQRKDGLWSGQIDVGYVAGKRRRKTLYAATQEGVVRKIRLARKAMDAGDLSTSSMRLDKWLRYWLDNIAPQSDDKPLKPRTLMDYRSKVEQYIIPTIGHHKLDKLTPAHVREMHKALREMIGQNGKPLSATSVHHAHRVLGNALAAAEREVGLSRNVARLVPAPAKAASSRRALKLEEIRAAMSAVEDDPMAFTRRLAAFMTGARQGELLGLRWSHVNGNVADFAWALQRIPYRHGCKTSCGQRPAACPSKALDIHPALECQQLHGNLCLVRPKTEGSKRLVPLAPPLPAALALLREADTGPNPHGLVWHRADGAPLNPYDDWQAWKALLTTAGVEGVTLHEIRHSTVTLLTDLGVDDRIIANIVGHSDVLTQAGYRHRNLVLEAQALGQLGDALAIEGPRR